MKRELRVWPRIDWTDWTIGFCWYKEDRRLIVGIPVVSLNFKIVPRSGAKSSKEYVL